MEWQRLRGMVQTMTASANIILVEDDPELQALVGDYLRRAGLDVAICGDGSELDDVWQKSGPPDLVILDLMLPGEDGLEICRRLRAKSDVPILFLTAMADDTDRIVGLELGADDYIGKPFNPRELLARIRAILRRGRPVETRSARLRIGHLLIDAERREVRSESDVAVPLTAAEFDLLMCFVERPGRVLSRDQLMDWTRSRTHDAFDRTIDVQISRLRKSIGDTDASLIKTVRGHGYLLAAPVEKD